MFAFIGEMSNPIVYTESEQNARLADGVGRRPRKRILFLSQCLPYPPHSGVTRRTYNILKQLQIEYDVHLVSFYRSNHQETEADVERAAAHLRTELFGVAHPAPIHAEQSLARRLWDHTRSVLTRQPYTYYEYRHSIFADEVHRILGEWTPDLVHLDSLDLYGWIDELGRLPVTCTHHSIESELLRLRANVLSNPLVAAYLRCQAQLVERVEMKFAPTMALNLMMSELDGERLRGLAPSCDTITVPNGVNTNYFTPVPRIPSRTIPGRVVFLGPTYMLPNRDAVKFFLESIWYMIRRSHEKASFRLIGKCEEEDRRHFETFEGVKCLGFVEDIRPILAEASCLVVPIRVGGGTRLKILEGWAMGCPIVSTSVGCEGLETVNGENIVVRDDPREFADAVVAVLGDEELQRQLGRQGRETAERIYSWPVIGETIRRAYRSLLGDF